MRHACVGRRDARPIRPLELIRFASSLLAPPHCSICGAGCAPAERVCARCLARLVAPSGGVTHVGACRVAWAIPYDGVARELVAALKFHGRIELARLAGSMVARAIERAGLDTAGRVVVPVPAAPLRLRRRGFDPGELIAAAVANELRLPVTHCLARRSTRRQVGRGRRARLADPPPVRVAGEVPAAALVVDDVLTTGATLGACATALRGAACADIAAAVFARSLGAAGGEA